jgi:hypothetical protein
MRVGTDKDNTFMSMSDMLPRFLLIIVFLTAIIHFDIQEMGVS